MRKIRWAMAALTLGVATGAGFAGDAPTLRLNGHAAPAVANQQLADSVAASFRASGRLQGYSIDIGTEGGVVTLTGNVANDAQRQAAVDVARLTAGVVTVRDQLTVQRVGELMPAAFQEGTPVGDLPPAMPGVQTPVLPGAPGGFGAPTGAMVKPPMPINQFAGGVAPFTDAPVMPPYAWPAYTPYNNFASMAYQTQYPAGAWPFIGPPHPYPMIPAGWRSVSLKWHKGYWWMRFSRH